jgi:hypothetical protein
MKKAAKKHKILEMKPFVTKASTNKWQGKRTPSGHHEQGQVFSSLAVFGSPEKMTGHEPPKQNVAEVAAFSLELPDAVWRMLDPTSQDRSPHDQGKQVTFYKYKGHLCLAPSQSLILLETSTQTNIFRGPDDSPNRAAFCLVLGVTEAELKHILETPGGEDEPQHDLAHLEDLLLLVCQTVRSQPTWGGVRDWLHQECLALGGQAPIAPTKLGQWRVVSNLVYGDIYGMF